MRLIDADKLMVELNEAQIEYDENYKGLCIAKNKIYESPTVEKATEALEKQIPHMPVITHKETYNEVICPKCHKRQFSIIDGEIVAGKMSNYCSNCG